MIALLLACAPPAPPTAPEPAPIADPAPVAAPEPPPPVFAWRASEIAPADRDALIGASWRPGCPTPVEDLRLLELSHWDFDGAPTSGRLVVHRDAVEPVRLAFAAAWDEGFRIRRVAPVADYGGDDDVAMAADATTAFNCRPIKGTSTWSEHSTGTAIDVNPVENPWVQGNKVDPPAGAAYLARDPAVVGLLHADSAMVRAFRDAGWGWGGTWTSRKDWQHFSASGR